MRTLAFLAVLAALSAGAGADGALNTLTVEIDGVGTRGGVLHVGVYDAASYAAGTNPILARTVKAVPGRAMVTFVGITPGIYAVKAVQDVNLNGAHDKTLLGATAEPMGYSNTADRRDRPAFRVIQFTVTAGDNRAVVHMHE